MGIFRWVIAGAAALLVGFAFGALTESVIMAAVAAALVLLNAVFLSWGRRSYEGSASRGAARRRHSGETGYVAGYGGSTDGGSSYSGDCGYGGDGGGSFGGDGGGAGGC